jgi:hypothetical protein
LHHHRGDLVSLVGAYLATLSGAGGSGSTIVALADTYVSDYNSGSAEASYSLTSGGDVFATTTLDGAIDIGDWISPKSAAPGSYEVQADVIYGSVTGSATGSWLALTSTRTWTLSLVGSGFEGAALTVSIRLSGTVIATATVSLEVFVDFGGGGGGVIP